MRDQVPRDYDTGIQSENKYGEYVPSIPFPYYGLKKHCDCGRKFWTEEGYAGHYALEHILGVKPPHAI